MDVLSLKVINTEMTIKWLKFNFFSFSYYHCRLGTLQSVHHNSHHQVSSQGMPCTNTMNMNMGGNSPLVMPVFPLRSSQSGHGSNYSPYSPSRLVEISNSLWINTSNGKFSLSKWRGFWQSSKRIFGKIFWTGRNKLWKSDWVKDHQQIKFLMKKDAEVGGKFGKFLVSQHFKDMTSLNSSYPILKDDTIMLSKQQRRRKWKNVRLQPSFSATLWNDKHSSLLRIQEQTIFFLPP